MITSLLLFELRYHIRQWAFWGMACVFLGMGWMLGYQGYVGPGLLVNSEYQTAYHTLLISLGIVFAIMFYAVSGVLRDPQHRFESILYTTSLPKSSYYITRYLGVFLAGLLVLTLTMVGLGVGTSMSMTDSSLIEPWDLVSQLRIWCLAVLPNAWIVSSIIFSVAVLTRKSMWTYLSAILLYALYWMCAIYLNSPMLANTVPASELELLIASLGDPFGLSAYFEQVQDWTTFQKNNQSISISGYLLLNRVLWVSIASLLLLLSYRLFSYRPTRRSSTRVSREVEAHTDAASELSDVRVTPDVSYGSGRSWHVLVSQFRIDLSFLFKNLPFIGGITFWLVIVVTEMYARVYGGGSYGEDKYPTTDLLIWLIADPLPFMGLLIIVYYGGILTWRERRLRFSAFRDAAPATSMAYIGAKILALLIIPFALLSLAIVAGICLQMTSGYHDIEIGLWISTYYYYGLQLVFYCILVLFIQLLVQRAYVGMIVTGLLILLLGTPISTQLGIEHPMLLLGAIPSVEYSNMTGYGYTADRYHDFASYWMSIATLMLWVIALIWPRGEQRQLSLSLITERAGRTQWIILSIIMIWIIGSTYQVYYQTNVVQPYLASTDILDQKEDYERRYKQYEDMPRLNRASITTQVDLYPSSGDYRLETHCLLVNKHDHPISTLFITDRETVDSMWIEGGTLVERSETHGTWLWELVDPAMPGDTVKYDYMIDYRRARHDTPRMIAPDGSYLMQQYISPSLSYRSSLEITDPRERKKRGLPPREIEEATESHMTEHHVAIGKIPFETVISTSIDQTALAPGDLISHWTQDDRSYYHYRSSMDIMPSLSYASGRYQVLKEQHQGISVEQYYHHKHSHNINAIQSYAKATLDYCIENFGAYPLDHLRIVEIPGHWRFGGQCMSGMISMVEDNLYLVDISDSTRFDLIAKRTIHEVAHQWWGHLLAAKNVPGGSLLIEGLAKYTEAAVMEQLFGQWPLVQLGESANRAYFRGRSMSTHSEPPIYLAGGENYLCYGKMYTAFLALKELIGADDINKVLADLVARHRDNIEASATSVELLSMIEKVTPVEYHQLIDEWFKDLIVYDLSIESASYVQLSDGRYEITLDVYAQRARTLDDGSTEDIGIDEPVMIGIYTTHPEHYQDDSDILYLRLHQISNDESRIQIITEEEPRYISVDPYQARTERSHRDNVKEITRIN